MNKTIAYFSAEYSVADSLPIYAGGLGILAGDIVMEAGAEKRDFHAVGLVYHRAFTGSDPDPRPLTERLLIEGFELVTEGNQPLLVSAPVGDRVIRAQVWRKRFGETELLLLDANVEINQEHDRTITDRLYDDDLGIKVAQQLLLGFGGIDLLKQLEITPDIYHLNEGHMSMAGLAVAVEHQASHTDLTLAQAIEAVRPRLVATKHTILPGAGVTLSRQQIETYLGPMAVAANGSVDDIMAIGGKSDGFFSTTKFLLGLAGKLSGVSVIHTTSEAQAHDGSKLIPITNGVFAPRWRANTWTKPPLELTDAELWHLHNHNRQRLLVHIAAETETELDPDYLTVVWARRMTAYKRPELLVSDLARLAEITHMADRPVQFIVAGQANPADTIGIDLMNRIISAAQLPELTGRLAYLPHYNPASARLLVQGADVWLNTPIRGQEACGTSGMKASLNGALQFSTSDGWIDEVEIAPVGWRLPDEDAEHQIYTILEKQIIPLFYQRTDTLPLEWIKKMRANIELIEHNFTATRMLHDYYEKLYN